MPHTTSVRDALNAHIRHNRPSDHGFFTALVGHPAGQLAEPAFIDRTNAVCEIVQHTLQLAAMKVPQLDAPLWHMQHLALLTDSFPQLIDRPKLEALPAMRRWLPGPLFTALEALDQLHAAGSSAGSSAGSGVGLGAWVLSRQMMLDWLAAILAAYGHHGLRMTGALFDGDYGARGTRAVIDLVQDVVQARPQLDGGILRGMRDAVPHWRAILDFQRDLILAESRR